MRKYTTVQGDMWDQIAFTTLGSEKYMTELMAANMRYKDVCVFSGGITLNIPDIARPKTANLPPWRRK